MKHYKGTLNHIYVERDIWIYLSPHYDRSLQHYPVFYLQDDIGLIDPELDDTLEKIEAALDPGVLFVCISQADRKGEYSPWPSSNFAEQYGHFSGDGEKYLEYIVNKLKPYVDHTFRTLPDRNNTGIAGASLGGLISLYAGIKYNQVFSKVIGISPSAWFEDFIPFAEKARCRDLCIYHDVGQLEGRGMIPANQELYSAFHRCGYQPEQLKFLIAPGGRHDSLSFSARFPAALKWILHK